MKIVDDNGDARNLPPSTVKTMIGVGWAAFVSAWIINIAFYKVDIWKNVILLCEKSFAYGFFRFDTLTCHVTVKLHDIFLRDTCMWFRNETLFNNLHHFFNANLLTCIPTPSSFWQSFGSWRKVFTRLDHMEFFHASNQNVLCCNII